MVNSFCLDIASLFWLLCLFLPLRAMNKGTQSCYINVSHCEGKQKFSRHPARNKRASHGLVSQAVLHRRWEKSSLVWLLLAILFKLEMLKNGPFLNCFVVCFVSLWDKIWEIGSRNKYALLCCSVPQLLYP